MDKLSIKNVSKRRRSLDIKKKKKDLSLLLNKDKLTLKEAQEVVDNFESISDNQFYAFERVLDLFKESYTNNYTCITDSEVQSLCKNICDIMPRLETTSNPIHDLILTQSREARNFAKRTMKNAEKYKKRALDPLDGSLSNIGYNNHIKDEKDYPIKDYRKVTIKDAPTANTFSVGISGGTVESCYEKIQETAKNIRTYDRVLSNHNKLCKRFNFNNVVEESKDFELCVYELCELIDSYDMPFDIKYNVALENILYLFELNHKFDQENPKYYIDEFFYTRDLSPENIAFIESICQENAFYYEKSKPIRETTNKINILLEASKDDPIKKEIDEFKKSDNKTIDKAKRVITKIYTKTPDQIVNNTGNILTWIRVFIIFGTTALNPAVGLLVFLTDKMISLHLKRKEIDKVLKYYKSEMNKTEKKIDKTSSYKTTQRLTKYYEELQTQYELLEDYANSLKSERELDEDDEIDEACLAEGIFDKITVGEELDEVKAVIKFEFKRVIERLKIASNNKYKKYFDNKCFCFVSEKELNSFMDTFDSELGRYLDAGGNICMSFCKCNMDKLSKIEKTLESIDILEELCSFCSIGSKENVSVKYEGTGNEMYLIFTYLEPLYLSPEIRTDVRENYFHPMTFDSIGSIMEISEAFEIMDSYPTDIFINNILSLKESINVDDVKALIEYFKNNSLFSIDESIDILSQLKESVPDLYRHNITTLVDNFIKESVEMENPMFDINIFREDVDTYVAIYEDLKEAIEKKQTQVRNKLGVNGVIDKLSTASNTLKLSLQSAKKSGKKLDSKQQEMSRQLDSSLAVLTKSMEQASVSKNREQIIKGSILPSASNIIKYAVSLGVTWAINPAIAVIGALSMLFVSKNATKKERALILDEIDIELKIVERKISRAESEDNDDAVRELYKIQNKLRREKQRLKYRMNVYYHQKPISTGKGDED